MAFGLLMSDDVWRFFVDEVDSEKARVATAKLMLKDWEWTWLSQVDALPREEMDLSNPFSPALEFKLRHDEYWIVMRPGLGFPDKPPTVNCAYQQGFSFDWYSGDDSDGQPSTLSDLVQSYREYCELLDLTISQLKLLENDITTLVGYSLDEDNSECFRVRMRLKGTEDEILTINVDWRNPLEFPSFLSSTDENRFANLDCEMWNSNDDLHINIRRILGELPEEYIFDD
ncbi:hypothetical protein Y032_0001g66 [Ancylostoma ceylanicum]|uniref:Uncharacterized protein n=1 Tax=Ancylostoma ceylanicum TaxID=53326 RepID=A0A016W6L6_9BILA|nr:hypothetical protein Y032_0001g66 [Ancylostoma ceylanicum]